LVRMEKPLPLRGPRVSTWFDARQNKKGGQTLKDNTRANPPRIRTHVVSKGVQNHNGDMP